MVKSVLLPLGLLATLALTAAPASAAPTLLPAVERTLKAPAGGTDTTTWTAPISGFVTVRTAASDRSDWDLDVLDATSRRTLAASHGFGSHEVAQSYVSAGQRLLVRATRRRGAAARVGVSLQLADVAPPKADGTPALVSVSFRNNDDLRRIDEAGLDLTHHIHDGKADVIVTGADQWKALRGLGLAHETEIADLNAHAARSRAADLRRVRAAGSSPLPSGRETYRVLQDYQDELKALAEGHPGLVRPVVLPKRSFQGRELMGVEIARDVDAADDGRPVYFVMGMHHAREWPSAEAAIEFAHLLVNGAGSDPRIAGLLERERVVVVPIVNPDGFVESREGGALGLPDPADTTGISELQTVEGVVLLGGSFAYRRKNCNGAIPSGSVPCTLQWGVDPNRNYGNGWGGPGAGSDPITQSYRGTGPFSEPETQAVWEYSRERQVTNLITIHNVAALVLRPPGLHDAGKAPDEPQMKELGDAMADAAGYVSQYSFELYDTSGTTDDYTYAAQGGYAFTIEMGPSGGEFHMPYQTGVVDEWTGKPGTPQEGRGLREALLLGAESAANPADHSVLAGEARPGAVLRIKKEFRTETAAKCTYAQGYLNSSGGGTPLDCVAPGETSSFADKVESTMVVPDGGAFEWHVNPSTRPFVGARFVDGERTEVADALSFDAAPDENRLAIGALDEDAGSIEREFEFTPAAGAEQMRVALEWGLEPQDYDLRLFKVEDDGTRTPVGDGPSGPGYSGRAPGSFEEITVDDPAAGTYVLRVIYFASVANDWTATVQQLSSPGPHRVEPTGVTEAYTLTCETPEGTVLSSQEVVVARGQRLTVNPSCG